MEYSLFNQFSPWFRTQYHLVKDEDGVEFICTKGIETVDLYIPEDFHPEDKIAPYRELHMKSTPYVALARLDLDDNEQILEFANTWGLLGLWNVTKYNQGDDVLKRYKFRINEIFEDPTKTGRNAKREPLHLFIKAAKDFQEYLALLTKYRETQSNLLLGQEKIKSITDDIKKTVQEKQLSQLANKHKVSRRVVENIVWLNSVQLQLTAERNEILKGNTSPQYYISTYNIEDQAGWYFNSLLSYCFLKTGEINFKRCEWRKCNKLFISKNPKSVHCSTACKNSKGTEELNIKRWKQALCSTYDSYEPEYIENKIDILLAKGISGQKRIEKELERLLKMEVDS
ncbi:hypothetical protein [Bacillus sp. Marseille-P3661]|uniref:hypothetical protein n=1 Tax=Bacillus sp. Marseille-P3661 TaxID=1936234 RepID=UPI000C8218E9|nr:hypothetical protein [Bacillus sp. Marseille-P3661]